MPREIAILSRREPDLGALDGAVRGVRGATGVRDIDDGDAVQVLAAGGVATLTVYRPRLVETEGEIARLLPDAPEVAVPVWWCDAAAPLGDDGDVGVRVALAFALDLDAVCVIAD